MSRNYEVLRMAQKDMERLRTEPVAPYDRSSYDRQDKHGPLVRDQLLRLIQSIFQRDAKAAPRMVVFSAVEHGAGCSWVAARVGETLAAYGGGTVCIVDANLGSPMLHRYFGISLGNSMTDALLQEGPVHNLAQPVQGSNLWLLSGKALPSDSAGVMNRERLKAALTHLRSEFAYVIVDAPPVNESADSILLGTVADGVVLVLDANGTRREAALQAARTLNGAGVRLLGTVLNKRSFPVPSTIYSRI